MLGRNWLSVSVVVSACLFGASGIWAQIDVNPTEHSVSEDDLAVTYEADVTCDYDVHMTLIVKHNGVTKAVIKEYVSNDGPSFNWAKTIDCSSWALAEYDTIEYSARGIIMEGPYYKQSDLAITTIIVSGSHGALPSGEMESNEMMAIRPAAIREETA